MQCLFGIHITKQMGRVKRIWYLSPMRAAKVQASLRIRAVSPEPPLLAHTSSESRGTFRQKARSLAPLNGWACAVKVCHDGMLEDTNSLDAAQILIGLRRFRELLLAGPVGAGAIRVMLQKCWKSSNGQNPRNEGSRPLWPSIKYTTIWSTLSRIGTCRRLVEGTGVPGPTLFSITVRMHTRMDWNFPPPRPQANCNLEWTYNRRCLCGDSWWV